MHTLSLEEVQSSASRVESVFYAFLVCVTTFNFYFICCSGPPYRERVFILVVCTIIFACSSVHMALHWGFIRSALFSDECSHSTSHSQRFSIEPTFRVSSAVFFVLSTVVAQGVFIWRSWVIWGKQWIIVVPPAVLSFLAIVFSGLAISKQAAILFYAPTLMNLGMRYFATLFCVSGLLCTLILSRLVVFCTPLHASSPIRTTIAVLAGFMIESGILQLFSLLVFLVLFRKGDMRFLIAESALVQITGITPSLLFTWRLLGFEQDTSSWASPWSIMDLRQFLHRTSAGDIDSDGGDTTTMVTVTERMTEKEQLGKDELCSF